MLKQISCLWNILFLRGQEEKHPILDSFKDPVICITSSIYINDKDVTNLQDIIVVIL